MPLPEDIAQLPNMDRIQRVRQELAQTDAQIDSILKRIADLQGQLTDLRGRRDRQLSQVQGAFDALRDHFSQPAPRGPQP